MVWDRMDEKQMVTVIKPMKGLNRINVRELWRYRDLFLTFVWRDLKVRYKQTVLGALWAVIPPVLSMVVFSLFFGNFAQMPSEGIPYPIFVFTGLLFWNYFSVALTTSGNSVISQQAMVQKIYFPRLLLPISSTMAGLVDFIIASLILLILMVYYGIFPDLWGVILFPILVLLTILTALGVGFFFAAVNVKYRDVKFVLPFFVQMGLFITPVIYPLSIADDNWKFILSLNPMATVVENARAGLLGTSSIDWIMLLVSFALSSSLFLIGIYYFRSVEKIFADVV